MESLKLCLGREAVSNFWLLDNLIIKNIFKMNNYLAMTMVTKKPNFSYLTAEPLCGDLEILCLKFFWLWRHVKATRIFFQRDKDIYCIAISRIYYEVEFLKCLSSLLLELRIFLTTHVCIHCSCERCFSKLKLIKRALQTKSLATL